MARPKGIPGYLLHKTSGRAYVHINGNDIYLGFHNSKDSLAEYDRMIHEWLRKMGCRFYILRTNGISFTLLSLPFFADQWVTINSVTTQAKNQNLLLNRTLRTLRESGAIGIATVDRIDTGKMAVSYTLQRHKDDIFRIQLCALCVISL